MDFTALAQPDEAPCPKCRAPMRDVSDFTKPHIKAFRCVGCDMTFSLPMFREPVAANG